MRGDPALARSGAAAVDELGFTRLHRRHSPELKRLALRLTGDHQTAEDVTQEALLRAWRSTGLVTDDEPAVRAWLFTVVRHLVVDRWRSAAVRHETVGGEHHDRAIADRTTEVLDRAVVSHAMAQLSPEHRQVITAAYYQRRTVNEIAAALDLPPGTVKSRLHYRLHRLRSLLHAEGVTKP